MGDHPAVYRQEAGAESELGSGVDAARRLRLSTLRCGACQGLARLRIARCGQLLLLRCFFALTAAAEILRRWADSPTDGIVPRQPASKLSPTLPTREARRTTILLSILPVASVLAAVAAVYDHWMDTGSAPLRAPAAVVLVLAAMLQAKIIARAYRRRLPSTALSLYRQPARLRWLLAGLVLCYGISLLPGVRPSARHVFTAAISVWYTLAIIPLAADGRAWRYLAAAGQSRWMIRFGHVGFAVAMLLPSVEMVIRLHDMAADRPVSHRFLLHTRTLPPGGDWGGWPVNKAGYCDGEFRRDRLPGVFRLAAIGDDALLCGAPATNCVARLEQSLDNLEVYRFALPGAGLTEYTSVLSHDVARYEPDLAVVFISLADDVAGDERAPGWFDWRSVRLFQWSAASILERGCFSPAATSAVAGSYEAYLDRSADQLRLCSTPMTTDVDRLWDRTFRRLERLADTAARRRVPLALVLVPCPYQVDSQMRTALARRCGCPAEGLDLELPQRRLARFAQQREIPVVDLLPRLRSLETTPFERNADGWNREGNQFVAHVLAQWLSAEFNVRTSTDLALRND